jgi:hypothetical protein
MIPRVYVQWQTSLPRPLGVLNFRRNNNFSLHHLGTKYHSLTHSLTSIHPPSSIPSPVLDTLQLAQEKMATDAMAPTPTSDLLASLEKHNANFTTLLSLIPSKFYVAPDPEEVCFEPTSVGEGIAADNQADNRYMKNKKRKTGEEIKEHKKRAKQNKVSCLTHAHSLSHLPSISCHA